MEGSNRKKHLWICQLFDARFWH